MSLFWALLKWIFGTRFYRPLVEIDEDDEREPIEHPDHGELAMCDWPIDGQPICIVKTGSEGWINEMKKIRNRRKRQRTLDRLRHQDEVQRWMFNELNYYLAEHHLKMRGSHEGSFVVSTLPHPTNKVEQEQWKFFQPLKLWFVTRSLTGITDSVTILWLKRENFFTSSVVKGKRFPNITSLVHYIIEKKIKVGKEKWSTVLVDVFTPHEFFDSIRQKVVLV
ncbi:hypothetical protein B9Z55_024952 [Caenorhabditis nigoni]|uniref:SH2 domain-containing protein n=1 Tax=Caenorhabditis nigoni TaxID=1611254 RepID=A0A2G5SWM8_9PELO|nr:hypothetical protein B9Z55_024952 [Caenorhabditis nigoni]